MKTMAGPILVSALLLCFSFLLAFMFFVLFVFSVFLSPWSLCFLLFYSSPIPLPFSGFYKARDSPGGGNGQPPKCPVIDPLKRLQWWNVRVGCKRSKWRKKTVNGCPRNDSVFHSTAIFYLVLGVLKVL